MSHISGGNIPRGSGLQGRRIHSLSGTSSGTSSQWLRASLAPLLIFKATLRMLPGAPGGALHHSVDHPCSDRSAALGRLRGAAPQR